MDHVKLFSSKVMRVNGTGEPEFSSSRPVVTVIIPIYEDWPRARECLSCLANQTFKDFEVVAVDNGSSFIPEIGSLPYPFQLLHCENPGSYSARNHGLGFARGRIIAFTDSDCLPDEMWLENGLKKFAEVPELDLVAGHVLVFARDEKHPTAVELYNIFVMFPQERSVRVSRFGVTANLFVKSSVIDSVGGFDARLKSSGDVQFCHAAVKKGFKIGYTPDAVVRHPARHDWESIRKAARRVGGGTVHRAMLVSGLAAFKMFLRISVPPIRNLFWIVSNSDLTFLQKFKTVTVLIVFKWAYWVEAVCVLCGKPPSRS